MFDHYGPTEGIPNGTLVNAGVELARDPVTGTLLSAPAGWLVGGPFGAAVAPVLTVGGGNLAYAAISHSPDALTNAMIERRPWQPGYENPSSLGRDLQNLLPDTVKDDYARNVHDFATDIDQVVATDFAKGDYVQGGASLYGDFVEGAWNSAGDTVDGYADQLATSVEQQVGGLTGRVLSMGIDGAGDVVEFGTDVIGQTSETLSDGAGWVGQKATDFVGWALGG